MAKKFLRFDGVDGLVTLGTVLSDSIRSGNATVSFWFYPNWGEGGEMGFFGIQNGVTDWLNLVYDEDIILNIRDGIHEDIEETTIDFYNSEGTEKWFHVAISFSQTDGDTCVINIYVDNVKDSVSGNFTIDVTDLTQVSGYIGSIDGSGTFMRGDIDDFRIYSSTLSDADVATIYNSGHGKVYSSDDAGAAAAAWDMNEGEGTTITDAQNSLEGTLSGGVSWVSGGIPTGLGGYSDNMQFMLEEYMATY